MTLAEEYKLRFDIVLHESKSVWDTGQLFLLANTFLASLLGTNLQTFLANTSSSKPLLLFLLTLLGYFFSVAWLISFKRTSRYYHYRLEEIKQFEKNNNMPAIFSGDSEKFANGTKKFNIKHEKIFGRSIGSFDLISYIILMFIIFYGLAFVALLLNFIS